MAALNMIPQRHRRDVHTGGQRLFAEFKDAAARERVWFKREPWHPIAEGGEEHRAELLLRYCDKDGNELFPGPLCAEAEQDDKAVDLDSVVVPLALEHASRNKWKSVTTNVHPMSLLSRQFRTSSEGAIAEFVLNGGDLVIEILETDRPFPTKPDLSFMELLADMGVRFALDDIGARRLGKLDSRSSTADVCHALTSPDVADGRRILALATERLYHATQLAKLDRRLVDHHLGRAFERDDVPSLDKLVEALRRMYGDDLEIVAEGARPGDESILGRAGVNYAQGFYMTNE